MGVAWLIGAAIAAIEGGELYDPLAAKWVRIADVESGLAHAWGLVSDRGPLATFSVPGPPDRAAPAVQTDGEHRLAHPNGATWTIRALGPKVVIESTDASGGRRVRERQIANDGARSRFIQEGREQMIGAGYLPADGRLAAANAALEAARRAFARPLPAALAPAARHVASSAFRRGLSDDWNTKSIGWLAGFFVAPRARDALIRHLAVDADDLGLAAEIAIYSRSPLRDVVIELGQYEVAAAAERERAAGSPDPRRPAFGAPWWEGAFAMHIAVEAALGFDPAGLDTEQIRAGLDEAITRNIAAYGSPYRSADPLSELVRLAIDAESGID